MPEDPHNDRTEIDAADATGARLREAFSRVAPESFPTIGVRESIVDAVRARRRHKQRVVWSLAASCVLIAGASVAATTIDVGKSRSNISAAPDSGSAGKGRAAAVGSAPQKSAYPGAAAATAAQCAVVSTGTGSTYGCSGVFSTPSTATYSSAALGPENQPVGSHVPSSSTTSENGKTGASGGQVGGATSNGGPSPEGFSATGSEELVVPVGRPVTITLPGSPGGIWTSPAVESGQGSGAAGVRTTSASAGIPGNGSSATFESGAPVTVVVVASELEVCGPLQSVCGTPTRFWSVVLEFRKG